MIPAAALAALLSGRWRQQARTVSLQEARSLAVSRTEDVAAARATQRRARAQSLAAQSAFWPQINGTGSYERSIKSEFEGLFDAPMGGGMGGEGGEMMEGFGDLPFGRDNMWRLGVSVTQELWSFGRTLRRVAGARAGERQADIGVTARRRPGRARCVAGLLRRAPGRRAARHRASSPSGRRRRPCSITELGFGPRGRRRSSTCCAPR